ILAATSALRHQTAILDDRALNMNWGTRTLIRIFSNAFASAHDLAPAIPFFLFLTALQVISPIELLILAVTLVLFIFADNPMNDFRISIIIILLTSLCILTRRLNYFEATICLLLALHL